MCNCKNRSAKEKYIVKLPGKLTITKYSLAAATAYAAKHPGSTVVKAS